MAAGIRVAIAIIDFAFFFGKQIVFQILRIMFETREAILVVCTHLAIEQLFRGQRGYHPDQQDPDDGLPAVYLSVPHLGSLLWILCIGDLLWRLIYRLVLAGPIAFLTIVRSLRQQKVNFIQKIKNVSDVSSVLQVPN